MSQINLKLPLILTQDTFLLTQRHIERNTEIQRVFSIKWLEWHLGAFAKYGFEPPIRVILTRLAEVELSIDELRMHLESTRAGVQSWLLQGGAVLEVDWQYDQRSVITARNFLVDMLIEEIADA